MTQAIDPYRELFERSADAILIIEGDRFVDCNEATVRMLRYADREKLLHAHPAELSPPTQPDGRDSYEKANEMMAIAFERGSHRFEWSHRRADGEDVPVEVLLTAIDEPGRRVLHVVWRDITDRLALEEQLRHAQKMEAVGKLAGGIAHDFNNLLVVILGHAELLASLARTDQRLAEHAQAIYEAGDRAAKLVKQLLTFGRKQQRLPEVLDLNELVDRLHGMLSRLIGEDLELQTSLSSERLWVEVDAGQIEQVIMNLISNARDASPKGGTLCLGTAVAADLGSPADGSAAAGRSARLVVTDNGAGMTPEVVKRAFDPFYTTKEPGRGTGLGLSTCHAIVQQSRGRIGIDSVLGQGTTVTVHLPLVPAATRSGTLRRPSIVGPSLQSQGEQLLVVEDEPAVREMIVSVLERYGYGVLVASDGLEGAEVYLANAGAIDLVITDVIMPGAGGPEMVARLAERGHRPAVLFLSGYTDDALTELHRVGAVIDLLEKPFAPDQLVARVRQALEGTEREEDGG